MGITRVETSQELISYLTQQGETSIALLKKELARFERELKKKSGYIDLNIVKLLKLKEKLNLSKNQIENLTFSINALIKDLWDLEMKFGGKIDKNRRLLVEYNSLLKELETLNQALNMRNPKEI